MWGKIYTENWHLGLSCRLIASILQRRRCALGILPAAAAAPTSPYIRVLQTTSVCGGCYAQDSRHVRVFSICLLVCPEGRCVLRRRWTSMLQRRRCYGVGEGERSGRRYIYITAAAPERTRTNKCASPPTSYVSVGTARGTPKNAVLNYSTFLLVALRRRTVSCLELPMQWHQLLQLVQQLSGSDYYLPLLPAHVTSLTPFCVFKRVFGIRCWAASEVTRLVCKPILQRYSMLRMRVVYMRTMQLECLLRSCCKMRAECGCGS